MFSQQLGSDFFWLAVRFTVFYSKLWLKLGEGGLIPGFKSERKRLFGQNVESFPHWGETDDLCFTYPVFGVFMMMPDETQIRS